MYRERILLKACIVLSETRNIVCGPFFDSGQVIFSACLNPVQ
jgi:hypothetical protein